MKGYKYTELDITDVCGRIEGLEMAKRIIVDILLEDK